MSKSRSVVILALLLFTATVSSAQEFKQRYIGKDPCSPEIKGEYGDFSLRLAACGASREF
jgi:hypothetical protein